MNSGRVVYLWNRLDHHMREVLRGTSVAFVLKVCGVGIAFGFNVLLARLLGTEGAGIYYLALSVTTIATVFGRMGLDHTLLRFVATNAAVGDWVSVKGACKQGIRLALVSSILSMLIVLVGAPWFSNYIFSKPELIIPTRLMSFAIIPVVMVFLYAEMLRGVKRIRDSLIVNGLGLPAISLISLYILGRFFGIAGAVCAYVFATVFMALFGYYLWRTTTPQFIGITGHFDIRKLLRSSMPLLWIESMNVVMAWTSIFLLGIWGKSSSVGIFAVAYRTALLTSLILVAANNILAPKFAALYKQGDMEALGSTARNSAKLTALIASPVVILFLLSPEWVMGFFGSQFVAGGTALAILAVGQFVNVAMGSVGYLLIMSGHERLMRNAVTLTAILNIILNLFFIPRFGIVGAAVATALSVVTLNLIASFMVYKAINIKIIQLPVFNKM